MPTASAKNESDLLPPWLIQLARKVAPWYGAVMSIYVPGRAIYGWMDRASDALRVPMPDLVFNVLNGIGAVTCLAVTGGLLAGLTVYHVLFGIESHGSGAPKSSREQLEKTRNRAALWVGSLVAAALAVWLYRMLVNDPKGNDFAMPANWNEPISWAFALIGAAVLAIFYGFFGRKLMKRAKALKTELERSS